jgi:hypothetical protein
MNDATRDESTTDDRVGVLIVDDHPLVRQGLAMLINKSSDLRVIGQAADTQGALALMAEKEPQVAVIDRSQAAAASTCSRRSGGGIHRCSPWCSPCTTSSSTPSGRCGPGPAAT